MDEILTTARDLEFEVNEDGTEELIMGHEDEMMIEELQEILNEEHQETQRNVSPSEQQEDERGPMPTSAIKDVLKSGRIVIKKCRIGQGCKLVACVVELWVCGLLPPPPTRDEELMRVTFFKAQGPHASVVKVFRE
ncbi:uncharacterized protein TNCV_2053211 [Trichonephila clavipes]|nr:uncharacterized protein TNCV_2053211 [Trichonephila clavipes]